MSAQENLNSAQFKPEHLDYQSRSYSHLDILQGANGPLTSKWRQTNPRTGFDEVQHVVEAHHPKHGIVGRAKWSDQWGNISVEVDHPFRNKGVGMRLVDEAHKLDPSNALRDLTPISHAGVAMADKVRKKYGVKDA